MAEHGTTVRDVAALDVARVGKVEETGDRLLPFMLLDEHGTEVSAVTEFLHHMLADDASPGSLRSYAYELLTWFRFLRAVGVSWHLAGRAEARDFALWLKTSKKPPRQRRADGPAPGSVNQVTGKATPGENYAVRTRRHARAVIRSFYEYHRETHGRPLVNPFPNARCAEDEHVNAHHNPMQPFRRPSRRAAYQPKEPKPVPRSIPDQAFNDLFAALTCNRDRALIAFYISTGARTSELLGVRQGLVAPEEQLIGVVRKGSRVLQVAPSKTDAERLLLVSPELAEVLTAIIFRVRAGKAALPLVCAYDVFEQRWSQPMPFLFQRRYGTEDRPLTRSYIWECLVATSQAAQITAGGQQAAQRQRTS